MAKKSGKKGTASKKNTTKKSSAKKVPKNKKTDIKQTKLEKEEKKGKLRVSQRERDEIDAVMDAIWSFTGALKNSWKNARVILIAGLIVGLIGVTFSGYGQEVVGVEQSGIWYAITESPSDLEASFDPVFNNREYREYSPGDEIRIEGKLTKIDYFGDIENGLYPIAPSGLDPAVAPGDSYKILKPGSNEVLFPVLSENNSEMNINFASGLEFKRVHFSNTNLTAAVFTDVKFEDVLFTNFTFTDSFFIDCVFERVTFADVEFSKSVMSNVTFDAVLFNNVTMESNRIENSYLSSFLVRSSDFTS
ncbi:MAG: pentapeptide repeat-containing protein, partial [Candidatus Poseidoniia archaeon]|nr:pentapeptide repeat-containing protein [Candidatus Poseidoniia archaeon]